MSGNQVTISGKIHNIIIHKTIIIIKGIEPFNPIENEAVVSELLRRCGDSVKIIKCELNGFKVGSKNATTGVFTEQINSTSSGVLEIQKVATSGRDNIVAAGTTVGANNASLGTAATIFNITPNAHGSGIANAAINTFVTKIGGDITTTILVDLHGGLASGGTADDVIGTDGGAANAYIAELTSAVNGIPVLFAPCKPGASPKTHILEFKLPVPQTGLQ